jgi:hypothetical protein
MSIAQKIKEKKLNKNLNDTRERKESFFAS